MRQYVGKRYRSMSMEEKQQEAQVRRRGGQLE